MWVPKIHHFFQHALLPHGSGHWSLTTLGLFFSFSSEPSKELGISLSNVYRFFFQLFQIFGLLLHLFNVLSAMLGQIFNLNCIFWIFTSFVILNPTPFNLGHVFICVDYFNWPFEVSYQWNILKLNFWNWKLILTIEFLPGKSFTVQYLNFWILKRFIKVWLSFCQVVFLFEINGADGADRSFRKV